jgi:hypothetical protein
MPLALRRLLRRGVCGTRALSASPPPADAASDERLPRPVRRLKHALAACPQEALASLVALDMLSIYGTFSAFSLAGLSFSSEVARARGVPGWPTHPHACRGQFAVAFALSRPLRRLRLPLDLAAASVLARVAPSLKEVWRGWSAGRARVVLNRSRHTRGPRRARSAWGRCLPMLWCGGLLRRGEGDSLMRCFACLSCPCVGPDHPKGSGHPATSGRPWPVLATGPPLRQSGRGGRVDQQLRRSLHDRLAWRWAVHRLGTVCRCVGGCRAMPDKQWLTPSSNHPPLRQDFVPGLMSRAWCRRLGLPTPALC